MATLYARREPVDDDFVTSEVWSEDTRHELAKKRDVQLYHDAEATQPAARYPWHYVSKPTKSRKWIVHNCSRWELVWLPDLQAKEAASDA